MQPANQDKPEPLCFFVSRVITCQHFHWMTSGMVFTGQCVDTWGYNHGGLDQTLVTYILSVMIGAGSRSP